MRKGLPGLVLAGALTTVCAAEEAEVRTLGFSAPVTVEADGTAAVGEISGPRDALALVVREQLGNVRFVPAKQDGLAVASQGVVHGSVVLQPAGADEYDVILRGVSMNPTFVTASLPDYPIDQARADRWGWVELRLTIAADGTVTDVWTVGASHPDFEKGVRAKARETWRFKATHAGTFVSVPVVFHTNSRHAAQRGLKPDFRCEFDERVAHVEGDSGCTEPVEVYGYRVKRVERVEF